MIQHWLYQHAQVSRHPKTSIATSPSTPPTPSPTTSPTSCPTTTPTASPTSCPEGMISRLTDGTPCVEGGDVLDFNLDADRGKTFTDFEIPADAKDLSLVLVGDND